MIDDDPSYTQNNCKKRPLFAHFGLCVRVPDRVPGKRQSFYLENPEKKKLKKSSPTDKSGPTDN